MAEVRESILFVQAALRDLESKLSDLEESTAGLEEFKSTLDNVRTTVLAVLAASDPSDYQQYVRRFRLRRATQVCQSILFSLLDGTTTRDAPGMPRLRAAISEVLPRLDTQGD